MAPLSESSALNSSQDIIIAGNGTAGSPDIGVVSVQGVPSGTPIPASQSGTWTTGRTWTTTSGTDSIAAAQSGTWNINNVSGTVSLPTGGATSGLQTTGNASLASIDAGIPTGLGAAASTNSMPVVDIVSISSQYRAQSVTTTAAQALGGTLVLSGRKLITITPTNGTVYWGGNASVTTTTGSPLFANNTLFLSFTDAVPVYLISAGTVDVRILEAS